MKVDLEQIKAQIRADFARSGGKARASKLSAKTRSAIASKAAKARWNKPLSRP